MATKEDAAKVFRAAKSVSLDVAEDRTRIKIEIVTASGMLRTVEAAATERQDAVDTALYIAQLWLAMADPRLPKPRTEERKPEPETGSSGGSERITVENVGGRRFPFGRKLRMEEMAERQLQQAEAWLSEGPGRHEDERKRRLAFVLLKLERERRRREAGRG